MDDGHVIPEEIRALLERRTTFQEWLAKLGELGSEFRPEVADKVRTDYESRLREVEGELEGHRAELESALAGRQAAVAEAAERHDARAAELEECELRYRVGEFDDEEWERRRAEHQSVLDGLDAELTTQRAAVGALGAVLGELVGPDAIPAVTVEAIEVHDEMLVEPAVDVPEDLGGLAELEEELEEEAISEPWMSEPFEVDDTALEAQDLEAVVDAVPELPVETEEPMVEAEEAEEEEAVEVVEMEAEAVAAEEHEAPEEEIATEAESGEFMDELEFLESLSLEDSESFDAVSAMLDDEEEDAGESGEPKREDT